MFAIAQKDDQYETYRLTDEAAQSYAEVVPERGGIVTRWGVQGNEMFYLDTERFTHPDLTVRGGIPILFPICGNLPDNTYTLDGQTYSLKQHGFARNLPWQVVDQSTEGRATITVALTSNDETRAAYPFDFRLEFTYSLQGNTLELHQRHINQSDAPMPFSTGLHPYFLVADKGQLSLDIPSTEYRDNVQGATHSFSGQFDFSQDEIDAAFYPLMAQQTRVTDGDRQLTLQIDYDSTYSTLVFWTVKGKDFYCLEPWSAGRNALNTGDNLIHLPPGETLDAVVRFTVLL
ncbi:MAG: aldose epimerase [Synechococcales bacterium]|nr:aldose epimerase [Synechococcales bacterium]